MQPIPPGSSPQNDAEGDTIDAGSGPTPSVLDVRDHSRDAAGLLHVYPVVSRRAGGLSIGINLNTNNACNWACSYCQVPGLTRGAAPAVDLGRLAGELRGFLDEVLDGDFMVRRVPAGMRRLNDIAFSGNGEPTASPAFAAACACVLQEVARRPGLATCKLVVISNGSHAHEAGVQAALQGLAASRGELWFKLDRGLPEGRRRVNGVDLPDHLVVERLAAVSAVIPTWIQTCLFAEDGLAPPRKELDAWLGLLARARQQGAQLQGVLLYTLARPSLQLGAAHLSALDASQLGQWAQEARAAGLEVRVSA